MVLGELVYTVKAETAQAEQSMRSTDATFQQLGQSGQAAAQGMSQLPSTYQTIVQEGNKVTTTTRQIQQTQQATITTVTRSANVQRSFGQALKDNILSIGVAASSIIGLVSQYTSLQRAQLTVQRIAVTEEKQRNRIIDLTGKLRAAQEKYGASSSQAAKAQRDLDAAEKQHEATAQRLDIMQTALNEKIADFAVNILPNLIGVTSGVIQVLQNWRGQQAATTVTTIESTGAQIKNATATKALVPAFESAGGAAKGFGISVKSALIGTGIGIVLVSLGSLLAAFATNWLGVRDAVNSVGVSIGNAIPKMRPLLDALSTIGKLLFGDVTQGAQSASEAMNEATLSAKGLAKIEEEATKRSLELWKALALGNKKERKDLLDQLGIKGGAKKRFKETLDDIENVTKKMSGMGKLLDFEFKLPDMSKLFDIPASVTKKAAYTLADRIRSIGKDTKFKKSFDELAKLVEKDAKKGGKHTGEIIGKYLIDHPALLQALQANGLIPPSLQAEIDKQRNEIAAEAADEAKWDAAFADERTPQEIMEDAWWDKNLPEGQTPEEKAVDNAKKLGASIATAFNAGLASVFGAMGGAAVGIFDFSFENIFGMTPEAAVKAITDDFWWAVNFMPDPGIDFFTAMFPTGDIFGGVDLNTIISTSLDQLFDPKAWNNAINTMANEVKTLGGLVSKMIVGPFTAGINGSVEFMAQTLGALLGPVFDSANWIKALNIITTDIKNIGTTFLNTITAPFVEGLKAAAGFVKAVIDAGIEIIKGAIAAITGGDFGGGSGGDFTNDTLKPHAGHHWDPKLKKWVKDDSSNSGLLDNFLPKVFGESDTSNMTPEQIDKLTKWQKGGSNNAAPWLDTLNNQIQQVTKVANLLGRAIRGLSADFGQVTKSAQQYIATNNILNHTIQQIFNITNVEGRAVRGISSDFGQLTKSIKQTIAANNILNRTETQIFRQTNVTARAVRGLSSDTGNLADSFDSATKSAKNFAKALIAVAVAAKKARNAGGGGGSLDFQAAATGYHGLVTRPTLFLAAEKGPEEVNIGPGQAANRGPGAVSTSGATAIINITIGGKTISQVVELELGKSIRAYIP